MKLAPAGRLLSATVILLLCVLYGGPLLALGISSLQPPGSLPKLSQGMLTSASLDSYRAVLNAGAGRALLNSAIIGTGVTTLVLLVGIPGAYWMSRVPRRIATTALLLLVFLQMVPEASAVIPLFQVLASWGIIGTHLAVILATTGTMLPFIVLLLGPFFTAVPDELYEAGSVDGAGQLRQFFGIAIPLVRNGIVTIGVLAFMGAWGQFVYAINLLADPRDYPVTGLITRFLLPYRTDWPGLMAASVVCAIPIVILYVVFQRRLASGLSAGALKG